MPREDRGDRGDRGGYNEERGGGGGGGRRGGRRRVCAFCVDKIEYIDYKESDALRRYISEEGGKILPRRKTGACARHQRWLATAIKRARHVALLPYTSEHVRHMS
jgi:small subunit ribosomal protein S18